MIAIDARARPPLIVTPRLALRELRVVDAAAVAAYAGDKRVAQFLVAVPSPYPIALATRWIAGRIAWWTMGRGLTLAIVHRAAPDALIGSASLRLYPRARRAELGYWLGVASWRMGFATEAAGALVDFGFRELGLERVYAQVLEGNDASCRVLDKLGMLPEGVRRRHVRKAGRLRDVTLYGMLYDEWLARQD
ncbi:MAG TPA: GNAT family protein [Kofleriaceae bacterium]|jgi:RimJ/RimL family protein N-acetyltransferase